MILSMWAETTGRTMPSFRVNLAEHLSQKKPGQRLASAEVRG